MAAVLAAAMLFAGRSEQPASASHEGGMDVMALDMDPFATPANDATSLGTTEPCARINENGIQDADEDAVDQLFVDVTAQGVPAAYAMIGYSYDLSFPDTHVRIAAKDTLGLLSTAPGYSPFIAGERAPDTTSPHEARVLDINAAGISGSGFLESYTIETTGALTPVVFAMTLANASHLDTANNTLMPDSIVNGLIAVNTPCPAPIEAADVGVTSVTVTSPASVTVGTTFTVSGGAVLHNSGPADPASSDVSFNLNLNSGCSAAEAANGTEQDVQLPLSTSVAVPATSWTWNVTCSTPGTHVFSVSVSAAVDDTAYVDPNPSNNTGSGSSPTTVLAESDLTVTAVSITAPSTMTAGTGMHIRAQATLGNLGPFGPTGADVTLTLTPGASCVVISGQLSQTNPESITVPVSGGVEVPANPASWLVRCEDLGTATFGVSASVAVDQEAVTDPNPGNNSNSAQAQVEILLPICGPDPAPAGDLTQNLSPQLVSLLSQLAGGTTPADPGRTTPLECNYSITVSDGKGAPIDDCEVTLLTAKPCTIAIDASIRQPGLNPTGTPTARLLPVAVSFLPPEFDLANDLAVTNGSPNGAGSFRIRTDGGLGSTGCIADVVFPLTPAVEGGLPGSVPETNSSYQLTDPNLWPNDLNAEIAAVQNALEVNPLPPADLSLWSRSIVPLSIRGVADLAVNVITWRIDDLGVQQVTGARWVVVAFPGDAVNPDPPGGMGGDPDADDPGFPIATCSPFAVHLEFSGTAGSTVARTCTQPGSHMAWALMDPDAVNFSGDDGPRSDTSKCSLDLDMDGLTENEEAYYGSNNLDPDSDDDTITDGTDNCPVVPNADQTNFDGDGEGDACDPDVDGDRLANGSDLCAWTTPGQAVDANGCSQAQVDGDGDGYCNPGAPSAGPAPGCAGTDNCPQTANPGQEDFDLDGKGDVCDEDLDGDGVANADEPACGGDPVDPAKRPERADLAGDENGDGSTTDGLPPGAETYDCDGDGFTGVVEAHIFGQTRDQDPCGTDSWPADLWTQGNSADRIMLNDLASFVAPVRRLGTRPGDANFNVRWDLVPGAGPPWTIALNDLGALVAGNSGRPPMLRGAKAFNGPTCTAVP